MSSSNGSSSGLGTSEIIGVVIGGVLALVTIIGIIMSCYAMCCKKSKPSQVQPQYPPYNPYGQQMNSGYYPQQGYPPEEPYWGPPPPNVPQQAYYGRRTNH